MCLVIRLELILHAVIGYELIHDFQSLVAKTIKKTDGKSGLQQKANALWKTLAVGEMAEYNLRAEEANKNPAALKKESRSKRGKRLTSLIRDSVSLVAQIINDWIG
jgi:hypothetical protein